MATGIKDKVAILGMGCSKFGERWDKRRRRPDGRGLRRRRSPTPASTPSRSTPPGSPRPSRSSTSASRRRRWPMALRLPFIPVTRVENYCASGTEAFRGAVYAVASGAADIALALGVEKLKDTGYGGLPQRGRGPLNDMTGPNAVGARQLRPARRRLSRQAQRRARGPQAGDGAHLGQEPRQRRQESQGASAQQDHRWTPCSMRRWWPSRSASTTAAA